MVQRVRLMVVACVVVVCCTMTLVMLPAPASAAVPGMPPRGKVLLGVGGNAASPGQFSALARQRHHILLLSFGWPQSSSFESNLGNYLDLARRGDYRLMVHLTNAGNSGGEAFTPRAIARGRGDEGLIRMSVVMNESNQYTYLRPMAEMNGHWNAYCAFNANGTRRDAAHSTSWYRKAFRRMTLVARGGTVASINATLRANGLPVLHTNLSVLPRSGRVAMVWNPQGEGSPNVSGNQPQDYYPGKSYVDYVANDLYSIRFRAHWRAQEALYSRYQRAHPFIVAEWAPWGIDDPAFVDKMFAWVASHRRTVGLIYFNGSYRTTFRLGNKPRSLARYRRLANAGRYTCDACGTTRTR